MNKEDREYLKEHEPWRYDDLYGDPVTGCTEPGGTETFGDVIILLGIIGAISMVVVGLCNCI